MKRRRPLAALALVLALSGVLILPACASQSAARRASFPPATPDDAREALAAWSAARERAASLPPSRLLYDARMGTSGLPSVPGTLAVTYDGERVRTASLTGPFGSRVAQYGDGVVTGEDKKAMVIDPDAFRSVLAGVWNGAGTSRRDAAPAVRGREGRDALLAWDDSTPYRAEAVLDLPLQQLRSLWLSGGGGQLSVSYTGKFEPWPERIAVREERSGRSLSLALIAAERLDKASEGASPASP